MLKNALSPVLVLRLALVSVLLAFLLPLIGCEPPGSMTLLDEDQLSDSAAIGQLHSDSKGQESDIGGIHDLLPLNLTKKDRDFTDKGGKLQDTVATKQMLELMAESEEAAISGLTTARLTTAPTVLSPKTPTLPGEGRLITGPLYTDKRSRGILDQKWTVALLVPLTGDGSELGQAMLNAATLALFDHFEPNATLLVRDTSGTPAGAVRAASEAIYEGAQLLIGPLFSESVRAAAPVARKNGVTLIGFSNDRSVAGNGVYVLGFTPHQQVKRIVSYAAASGLRRMVALVPYNDYGFRVAEAFDEGMEEAGLTPGHIEYFELNAGNATDIVQRIAALYNVSDSSAQRSLDAVLIAAGGRTLRSLATRFPYFDFATKNVRLLGTELWNHQSILGEPALNGGWFAAPPPGKWEVFDEIYTKSFRSSPPRGAVLAYDAIALAGTLINSGELRSGVLSESHLLTSLAGFTGVQGVFRFNLDGVAERPLAIYQVSENSIDVIDASKLGVVEQKLYKLFSVR